MMDIIKRINEFTLDWDGYNTEHNCMLLDAIIEIESLRAKLAEESTSQASDGAWTSNDIDDSNCNSDTLEQFCRDNIRLAPFFVMLANKLAAQPTPSQSEPVGEVRCRNGEVFGFIRSQVFRDMLPLGTKLYTKPQPTSQEYCCTHSWKYAKNKAWNNRNLKLCKCDHNELCGHCYPDDFKDGGKWDLCKPEKAN